ncbi:solute carrier family 35 member G1 isoform X2 [Agrilus planipennis]|uniref:Solute carrier family 35 member G1 isoform X2 n=1 Tax=Agrilus planipennis TaxID=224129 RepID=A0A1W4WCC4_AGRPL|nr:solute carrier family 35 member G1 isoform X2 [Agrilus planipennis]
MSRLHLSNTSTATTCDDFELQRLVVLNEETEDSPIFHQPKLKTCQFKWMAEIDPTALAAYRYVGVLLPAIPVVLYKQEPVIPKGKCMVLILRCFTGTMSLMLSFYAFRHMSLADASVIIFSVPVFTAIFARMFLKEPCGIFTVFSIVLTVIGVIFIARPSFLFGSMINSLGNSRGELEIWGIVAAFSATLFGASIYVLLRALKGVHFSVLMSNFGAFALVQCLLISWWVGGLCMPPCGFDRLLIVALAVFSFSGQILLTLALQMEQAGPVSIARSADIVFAFIWQVLFFEEVPNRYSVTGAVLVLTSVILTGMRKWAIALPETSSLKHKLKIFTK